MRIIGQIHSTHLKNRIIGIKAYKRILYLHFQNSQMNQFKRYFYKGVYLDLDYEEQKTVVRAGISAYSVNFIQQIFSLSLYKKIHYYDHLELSSSLSDFLNSLGNILFLDLEMTMPSYAFSGKEYHSEIIQVGYVLVNGIGKEIHRYSEYIKPIINPVLSKRTIEFLNINPYEFKTKAIAYKSFYEDFKTVLTDYKPTIVIFGKNDRLMLNQSFEIHKVQSLNKYVRYVNLSKLIQNYYNLKNEPGLFKLYQAYYENEDIQVHDAFNDSYVTKAVFDAFKSDVEHTTCYSEKIRTIFEPK
ncbi:MAG: hypothetical protein K2P14_02635 [Anaeroplasmataceae bacterium]|nr:hypothetical protein [Anaeroplasmataceae bacterium]